MRICIGRTVGCVGKGYELARRVQGMNGMIR